jgi:ankyrin repeat protein
MEGHRCTLLQTTGKVEAIKLLVQLGVNKEAQNVHGATPIHAAAVMGHVAAIKALAELGVRVDAQAADRTTPLQVSLRFGQHQAAQVLRPPATALHWVPPAPLGPRVIAFPSYAKNAANGDSEGATQEAEDGGCECCVLASPHPPDRPTQYQPAQDAAVQDVL